MSDTQNNQLYRPTAVQMPESLETPSPRRTKSDKEYNPLPDYIGTQMLESPRIRSQPDRGGSSSRFGLSSLNLSSLLGRRSPDIGGMRDTASDDSSQTGLLRRKPVRLSGDVPTPGPIGLFGSRSPDLLPLHSWQKKAPGLTASESKSPTRSVAEASPELIPLVEPSARSPPIPELNLNPQHQLVRK